MAKNTSGENTKREYKAFKFELESTGEGGEFSGYAAVFGNKDDGGDIIEKGAFTQTLTDDFDRIKILSQHDSYELPIGKPLELREDDKGLFIRGKISDTQKGRDIQTLLKDKVLTELSIGYDAIEFFHDKTGARHLTKIRLWEVSIVTWAMNSMATIDEVKSATEALRAEAKAGKLSQSRINALKPFIAVVRELVEILSPFLDPPTPGETPPTFDDPKPADKTKQTKSAGHTFRIVPNKKSGGK